MVQCAELLRVEDILEAGGAVHRENLNLKSVVTFLHACYAIVVNGRVSRMLYYTVVA